MTAKSDQLARIAAVAPPPVEPATKIYKLHRGIDVWTWLCAPCLKARLTKGWALMEKRMPPHDSLKCEDCNFKKGQLR